MAYYEQIATEIRKKIIDGVYPKDSQLPTQMELAKLYQTSRVTIQKALNLLQVEGLVEGRQGSGSYVNGPNSVYDYDASIYGGMTRKLGHLGTLNSKIISFEVSFPDEKEQEKLKIKKNDPIYDIIRLRIFEGEPIALEYTVMPVLTIPGITEEVLEGSIYRYINKELHMQLGKSHRRIKADRTDQFDIQYLDCKSEDPILEVEQTVYLAGSDIPFEYSQTRHRYDRGDITITNLASRHDYHL